MSCQAQNVGAIGMVKAIQESNLEHSKSEMNRAVAIQLGKCSRGNLASSGAYRLTTRSQNLVDLTCRLAMICPQKNQINLLKLDVKPRSSKGARALL